MAELEASVLGQQCLDPRMGSIELVRAETKAWEQVRNKAGTKIECKFTREKADKIFKVQVFPD